MFNLGKKTTDSIKERVNVNPESFPPLKSSPAFIPKKSIDPSVDKVSKREMIEVFEKLMRNQELKMNEILGKVNDADAPVVCREGHLRLECKDPLKVPNSISSTPQSMRPIK